MFEYFDVNKKNNLGVHGMNKKYIVPIALITSMTILQSPAYSQLDMPQVGAVQKFGFQPNANPASTRRGQPGLSDMMNAWEQ